jgi:hypothetical protein
MSKLAVFQETSTVATYMQAKFPMVLLETSPPLGHPDFIPHPAGWSLDFALEVDLALDVIARAFRNQGACFFLAFQYDLNGCQLASTDWDVRRYADRITMKYPGIGEEFEETMQKSFKPLKTSYHLEVTPCTITDRHGWVLVWYLPNILRPERQVRLSGFTIPDWHWRKIGFNVRWPQNGGKGVEDWFDQVGFLAVRPRFFSCGPKRVEDWELQYFSRLVWAGAPGTSVLGRYLSFWPVPKSEEHLLKVSAELRDDRLFAWLKKCQLPFALIGGILSIIQPELYNLGLEALRKLELHPEFCDNPKRMLEILGLWYAPFSALSVISNRATPLHCDIGGRPEWMDLMLALGNYDDGRFSVPAFGYTFKYNPGTMIAFSSKIFRHGTTCEGDRAGIAFYMRDSVMNRLGVATGQWLHQTKYQDLYPPPDPVYTYYRSM